jgi:hypothetical protein
VLKYEPFSTCIIYGVGHKQYVLKNNDRDKFNTKQIVKYNLANTRKSAKTEAAVGKKKHYWRRRVSEDPL